MKVESRVYSSGPMIVSDNMPENALVNVPYPLFFRPMGTGNRSRFFAMS